MALERVLKPLYDDYQKYPHRVENPVFEKCEGRQLVSTHFRQKTQFILDDTDWKAITTLRDPMLTFICQVSRKSFNPRNTNPDRIFNCWELFIENYHAGRLEIVKIGADFPFVTTTYNYMLHDLYKDGQVSKVKKHLGSTWDRVVELGESLSPILEKEGYGGYIWQD